MTSPHLERRRLDRDTLDLLAALLEGRWDVADAAPDRPRAQASGIVAAYTQFHLERSVRSLAYVDRVAATPRSRSVARMTPKPKTHKDAVDFKPIDWTGIYPPAARQARGARPRRDRHGRQRPLGERARASRASRATKRARRRCSTSSPARSRSGVKHLSVYAFSTENWSRSPDEVRFLMGFNRDVLHRRRDQLNDWGVRVRWAGRKPRLWASVIKELQFAEQLTADNDVLTLTMCVNYGGRNELTDAVQRDRSGCRGRPTQAVGHHGANDPAPPVSARLARRRPLRAVVGRAAHEQLHAVAERVRRDGVSRHPVARLHARTPVASSVDLRAAQSPLRRCGRRAWGVADRNQRLGRNDSKC